MRTQTYFHTNIESDANIRNNTVPLQVNCCGVVADSLFTSRNIRKDFYYMYVLKGEIVTKEFKLFPGDMILFEPGTPYEYRSIAASSYLWVHFTGFEAATLIRLAHLKLNTAISIGLHEELNDCFQKLFREFIIHDEAAGQIVNCLLQEILALTGRYTDQTNNPPLLAIEYIHSHVREEIAIDKLAQLEHMSATAFRIAFKQHTGSSPIDYVISQKISAACRLLSQTNRSISEVAAEVGYHDQYYFSRIFKKKLGTSPMQYRKQMRTLSLPSS